MLLVCKSSRNKTVSLGAKSTFPFGGPPLYPINSYSSFFFFCPSHLLSSPFLSLSFLVVTQIRGH